MALPSKPFGRHRWRDTVDFPDAAGKISRALQDAGAGIVARPMAFYVKGGEGPLLTGEAERAIAWAESILATLKGQASDWNL